MARQRFEADVHLTKHEVVEEFETLGGAESVLVGASWDGRFRGLARRVQQTDPQLDQARSGRRSCHVRGAQLPLPPGPPRRRVRAHPSDGRPRQGRRDPRAPPPTGRPAPSGRPTAIHLVRPSADRRPGQARATRALGGVPRHPRDDPALAPGARPTALDLPAPTTRAACPARRDRRADRPPRPGEPPLGLPAHRRAS